MAISLPASRENGKHVLFLIEFLAVFFWSISTLSAYFFTATPLLHSLSPSFRALPPTHVFYSLLVALMAIWELFGLSLGSPFNPCVTLSLAIAGETRPTHAAVMIFAQFLAHLAAVFTVRIGAGVLHRDVDGIFTPPQPHEEVTHFSALAIEAFITALLCVVALSLKHMFHEKATFKKWSLMTMLVVAVLDMAGEWTGSCMNPAMSFALAVFEGTWEAHFVYWIGPITGACAAGIIYNRMFKGGKRSMQHRIRIYKAKTAAKKTE